MTIFICIFVKKEQMHKKIHFPNLNGLRFIAATIVIIHHIEQIRNIFGIHNYWNNSFVHEIGKLGVILFFSLSGFLITYLLLNERDVNGSINIKNFYLRRIFRIWPLYYLIVILAFFILPNFSIFYFPDKTISYTNFPIKEFIGYIVMLPNLVLSHFPVIPYASQAWSIGTEEQFYLIWPLIFMFFIRKEFVTMLILIFVYIFTKKILSEYTPSPTVFNINILSFWNTFNIDCMAIGGLFAYVQYYKIKFFTFLVNDYLFILTFFISIFLISIGKNFGLFNYEIYSILFSIIILNLACNNGISNILEYKPIEYLGSISYGLYMYHVIIIVPVIYFTKKYNIYNSFIIYVLVFGFTICISHLSYKYYEAPFLRLKNKL
ncbi:hypothetical protein CQS02_00160 [Elizabethkingia miricola]|nr:hypothetical protein CQS02_00160 [Elizabethkingia miricola]MCT4263338.1 acyltransferase [Elizabethkingia anophelis]